MNPRIRKETKNENKNKKILIKTEKVFVSKGIQIILVLNIFVYFRCEEDQKNATKLNESRETTNFQFCANLSENTHRTTYNSVDIPLTYSFIQSSKPNSIYSNMYV